MGLATLRIMLLGGVALAMSTSAGLAQNANTTHVTLLERLVIGAGTQKVAIDTPQAVTVVDQEDLDRQQAASLGDVLDDVPGVTAIGSDRALGESFNIRGIGGLAAADESKIVVNVDGTPKFYEQYRMGSFFSDMELYKQVEVLRGPAASTLYGSGALGGVINLTTKDASDFIKDGKTGAVRVKSTYNSNGNGRLVSGIAALRAGDNIELLIAGNYRASDDIQDGSDTIISGTGFDAFSGLVKGTIYLDDNHERVARLSYQRWQSDADDQAYSQTGTLGAFGKVDRDVTDQTVTLSYEDADSDNPWLDLNVALSFSDTLNKQENATAAIPSVLFEDGEYSYRTLQLKADNTFEYTGDDFENYLTVGIQAGQLTRTARPAVSTNIGFHPEGVENKIGLYVQNELIWDERLTLIAGLRADFLNQLPDSSIPSATTINAVAWSPKLAALYDFNENISVFGSIAHTERQPTLDELFSTSGPGSSTYLGGRIASLGLEKESSNNYEIGAALSAFDLFESGDTLNLKVTGFYNELNNLISGNPDTTNAGAVAYYANIDKAHIMGVEVEGAYNSEYVFGRLGYSMIVGIDDTTGIELNTIPAHKLVATIGGRLPEYDLEYGWKSTLAAETTAGTSGGTPAYMVHGLFASWQPDDGAWEGTQARFSIDNVFNLDYQDNLAGDKARGRTFKLAISKQFDY